jgi:hypothetical protein
MNRDQDPKMEDPEMIVLMLAFLACGDNMVEQTRTYLA